MEQSAQRDNGDGVMSGMMKGFQGNYCLLSNFLKDESGHQHSFGKYMHDYHNFTFNLLYLCLSKCEQFQLEEAYLMIVQHVLSRAAPVKSLELPRLNSLM